MPPNPALTFADAVAVIRADDAELVRNLNNAESKVTASVGKMQASFDKVKVATKDVGVVSGQASVAVSALAQASTLSGSAAIAQSAQFAALALTLQGVSAKALTARISLEALKTSMVATTGVVSTLAFGLATLGAALPALIVRHFKTKKAREELNRTNEILARSELRLAKATAELAKRQQQQLQLEQQLAVFRGAKPSDFLKGQAQKIAQELETEQILKRQRELASKMDRERLDAADRLIAKAREQDQERKAFFQAERERFSAAAGPQTANEAARLFQQIFRQSVGRERALEVVATQFAELSPALKAIARGPLASRFPGLFPEDDVTKPAGFVRSRRVEAFQGLSGSVTASLDKERNRLLVINNTKMDELIRKKSGLG